MQKRKKLDYTEETKQQIMDFIFGKSEESPIKRNKSGDIVGIQSLGKNKEGLENMPSQANVETGTKLCKCCGEEKDMEEFYVMNSSNDGIQAHCISCQKKRMKESQEN